MVGGRGAACEARTGRRPPCAWSCSGAVEDGRASQRGTLRDEDAAALRDRVADVAVCRGSCSCTPSMEIPGTDIDWVDSPFEW